MWKEIKLDEFLTQKKRHISIEPDTEYSLVTISNKGKVKLREVKNGANISAQTGYIAKEGDFIYSRLAVHTGAFGIVPAELDGAFITGEMPCFEINKNKILPEILVKMIGLPDFLWQLKQLTKGMGRVRIKENMLLSTSLIMPDIKQQKEIVGRIKNIETEDGELKTELTYQQTLIKKLRQQILQEAIEGKLTAEWRKRFSPPPRGRSAKRGEGEYEHASVLLERIIAEKNQMIKDKKIRPQKAIPPISDEDKPFLLPTGWVWCRLGELIEIKSGKRIHASDYRKEGIPFLRSGETSSLGRGEPLKNELFIDKEQYFKIKENFGVPKHQDILIACIGGSIGNTWVVDKREFYFKDGNIVWMVTIPHLDYKFLLNYLKSPVFYKNTILNATDSSYNALTIVKLNESVIAIPPLAEQQNIVAKVEKLLAFCDQLETKITENKTHTEQLMCAVLKEAFAQK